MAGSLPSYKLKSIDLREVSPPCVSFPSMTMRRLRNRNKSISIFMASVPCTAKNWKPLGAILRVKSQKGHIMGLAARRKLQVPINKQ